MSAIVLSMLVIGAGPWDLAELRKPPQVEWVDRAGSVRQLYYESEPLNGKPTRVFAYYAEPASYTGKLPAIVLVHGGGGTAFREWAELWAKRGYAALAMDLARRGPDKMRLPDGGPDQDGNSKIPPMAKPVNELWTYHAIAAVLRGASLLQSLPQVDPDRLAITGISWGGYLTCIAAGVDDRFKAAVPVYGCGFLADNSTWKPTLDRLDPAWRKEWLTAADPSSFLAGAAMPMLFVNGTNDFAYPLDSYQKSYRLVKDRKLCVTVKMPHGHPQGWAPKEIGIFVDQHLNKGEPFPPALILGDHQPAGEQIEVTASADDPKGTLVSGQVHWTTDLKLPWQKREWQSVEATVKAPGQLTAKLPKGTGLVYFFTAKDRRGATVSSEHTEVGK